MSGARHSPAVEVAVIGGGVVGLAVAWRLAQRGTSVTLFERGELGAGASQVAAGMLAPVSEAEFGRAGQNAVALGLAAASGWPQFAAELAAAADGEVGLRQTGTLIIARDRDEADGLEREIAFRRSLGLAVQRLRASQARELEPSLAPTIRLALRAPDDHSVDPRRVTESLALAAARAGATLRPHTPVARVCVDAARERVTAVQMHDGTRVTAEHVVVAAGAWSGALEGLPSSVALRVRPVKGQTLRLRDPAGPGLLEHVVRFDGGYVVPRGDGRYVLGASVEERGFDTTATAGGIYTLLREAHELLPGVSEMVIEEIAVGLRPGSPDNLPVVGAAAYGGLHWATGHYRNGILLAPLTAEMVSAGVAGEPPDALARACTPRRFLFQPATA